MTQRAGMGNSLAILETMQSLASMAQRLRQHVDASAPVEPTAQFALDPPPNPTRLEERP